MYFQIITGYLLLLFLSAIPYTTATKEGDSLEPSKSQAVISSGSRSNSADWLAKMLEEEGDEAQSSKPQESKGPTHSDGGTANPIMAEGTILSVPMAQSGSTAGANQSAHSETMAPNEPETLQAYHQQYREALRQRQLARKGNWSKPGEPTVAHVVPHVFYAMGNGKSQVATRFSDGLGTGMGPKRKAKDKLEGERLNKLQPKQNPPSLLEQFSAGVPTFDRATTVQAQSSKSSSSRHGPVKGTCAADKHGKI